MVQRIFLIALMAASVLTGAEAAGDASGPPRIVTQISDGQIQAPPTYPVTSEAIKSTVACNGACPIGTTTVTMTVTIGCPPNVATSNPIVPVTTGVPAPTVPASVPTVESSLPVTNESVATPTVSTATGASTAGTTTAANSISSVQPSSPKESKTEGTKTPAPSAGAASMKMPADLPTLMAAVCAILLF